MKKFLGLLLIFYILGAKSACAQSVSLSVSPARQEIVAKPGSEFSIKYTIINKGDPVYVTAGVRPFVPNSTNGPIELLQESGDIRFTSANDTAPLEKSLFLKSRESIQIPLDVLIPKNLKQADYYYAFYIQSEPPPGTEGGTSMRVQQRIVSQLYITVSMSGTVEVKPKIALFTLSSADKSPIAHWLHIVNSDSVTPIVLTVANNGANAYLMSGELKSTYLSGSQSIIIPEQVVLGSSTKNIDIPALTGVFFGPVTVSLNLTYGESGVRNFAQLSFFVVPYSFWPAPLIILFTSLLFYFMHRRRK